MFEIISLTEANYGGTLYNGIIYVTYIEVQ